jgi:hypothetical protein
MTKTNYTLPTPINQAKSIRPAVWQKHPPRVDVKQTWQDQLRKALERDPERLDFFYIPVHVVISHLPANILYSKIIEDMYFLQKADSVKYERCIQRFDDQYQEFFHTQNPEIIPFQEVVCGVPDENEKHTRKQHLPQRRHLNAFFCSIYIPHRSKRILFDKNSATRKKRGLQSSYRLFKTIDNANQTTW